MNRVLSIQKTECLETDFSADLLCHQTPGNETPAMQHTEFRELIFAVVDNVWQRRLCLRDDFFLCLRI